MNKVILIGRLTRDPEIKHVEGESPMTIGRYTLAVDKRGKQKEGQPTADFISCVAFGRNGEFAEKYLKQGVKIAVTGRIQTGKYTNKEGQTVYTTDVIVDEHEFVESKKTSEETQEEPQAGAGYMDIPEGIEQDLPFK